MTRITEHQYRRLVARRSFLKGGAALAALPLLPWSEIAHAAEPYRLSLGDAEVSVVSDGELTLPLEMLSPDATPEQLAEIARTMGWTDGKAHPSANIPLIRMGDDLILVDTGSGNRFAPTAGKLMENLAATGVEPGAITRVVFTHAHPDHVWGTALEDGSLRFPNATYHVGATEHAFWTDPDIFSKLPENFHDFARGAQRDLGAIKDRMVLVKGGDDIATGLTAIDTPGHTPGHISLALAGGDGLIITGDALTSQIISFEHPGWKFGFDAIPDVAIENRRKLIDRMVADKSAVLGFHFAYPGVGMAEASGDAFRYVAA